MTLMIVRWRRVRTWLIRFLPFLSTLSMRAMKEFVHRMRLHYFLKTTVRDILGRGDCTKGDPFYRSVDWVCPESLHRSHTLRKLTQLIFELPRKEDNPIKSCIIEEERFYKSRRFFFLLIQMTPPFIE